jgi:hypothetical protein
MSKLESLDSQLYQPLSAAESSGLAGGLQCIIGKTNDGHNHWTIDDWDSDGPQAV